MIEPVIMDYNGEPVSIENGEMLWWYGEEGTHWNAATRQFEPDEDEEEEEAPNSWDDWDYDIHGNAHYRRRESDFDEQRYYFCKDLFY